MFLIISIEVMIVSVHENLRRLRRENGMTQEQVAQRLGVTRQALSGYELGRTRPDIDTLMRLADIYGVSLEDLLYGQTQKGRARTVALVLFALLTGLTLVSSALLWSSNYFFPMKEGQVSQAEMEIFHTRMRMLRAWEITDGLILTASLAGFLVLLVLLYAGREKVPWKTRLTFAAALAGVLLLIPLVFSAADPVHKSVDYIITPCLVIFRMMLFIALSAMIDWVCRRKKSAA